MSRQELAEAVRTLGFEETDDSLSGTVLLTGTHLQAEYGDDGRPTAISP